MPSSHDAGTLSVSLVSTMLIWHRLLQKKLDEQTSEFQALNLPPGYATGDAQAITSVVKVICSQLKADKTYFAKLVSKHLFVLLRCRLEPPSFTAPGGYTKRAGLQHPSCDAGPIVLYIGC